jgi:hypothetical protein
LVSQGQFSGEDFTAMHEIAEKLKVYTPIYQIGTLEKFLSGI